MRGDPPRGDAPQRAVRDGLGVAGRASVGCGRQPRARGERRSQGNDCPNRVHDDAVGRRSSEHIGAACAARLRSLPALSPARPPLPPPSHHATMCRPTVQDHTDAQASPAGRPAAPGRALGCRAPAAPPPFLIEPPAPCAGAGAAAAPPAPAGVRRAAARPRRVARQRPAPLLRPCAPRCALPTQAGPPPCRALALPAPGARLPPRVPRCLPAGRGGRLSRRGSGDVCTPQTPCVAVSPAHAECTEELVKAHFSQWGHVMGALMQPLRRADESSTCCEGAAAARCVCGAGLTASPSTPACACRRVLPEAQGHLSPPAVLLRHLQLPGGRAGAPRVGDCASVAVLLVTDAGPRCMHGRWCRRRAKQRAHRLVLCSALWLRAP